MELDELQVVAKRHGCFFIIVSNESTVSNIVPGNEKKPSMDDWRGSVLTTTIPILITLPLSHIYAKTNGRWILHNDLQKIQAYKKGAKPFTYSYEVIRSGADISRAFESLYDYPCVTVDIETTLTNKIASISFTLSQRIYKLEKLMYSQCYPETTSMIVYPTYPLPLPRCGHTCVNF